MKTRFHWYERVTVASNDSAKTTVNGKLGSILGMAQGDNGAWSYAVFIYDDRQVWTCSDGELVSTGEFDQRESFFDD